MPHSGIRSKKMKPDRLLLRCLGCVLLTLFACTGKADRETPTQGKIRVLADPSVARLSKEWKDTFEHLYTFTEIELGFARDAEAFNLLLDDSVRMVILPRRFTTEQKQALAAKRLQAKEVRVALDAVAVIVHPQTVDTFLKWETLYQILRGDIREWKDFSRTQSGDISLVVDQAGSSIVNFLQDSVLKGKQLPSNAIAAGGAEQVIDFVAANPGAIGFVGVNWISSANDSMTLGFLSKVKPAYIQNPDDQKYYLPYQAWIGQQLYPLRRDIYALTLESKMGLASGFISFMAGDKGQRIVLKSGLMPAQKPVRMIELQ